MNITIFLMIFLTLLTIFYMIISYFVISKQSPITRLKKFMEGKGYNENQKKSEFKLVNILTMLSKTVKNLRLLDGYRDRVQKEMIKAHLPLKAEEFITLRIILALSFMFGSYILVKDFTVVIIFGVLGWLIPKIYVGSRISKRIKRFNDSLGDAIVLISNSLKAGYSFFQAVDLVSKEMTGPIAEEFSLLQKEINYGYTTEEALENLLSRVKSDDLELVITAVLIQRQIGGNLAEILDNISTTIRERIRIKGEIKTLTAQGKMSGIIISLLPPGLGLIIYLINPEHIKILFTEKVGIIMVIISIIMELMGILFIKKIVDIKV